MHYLNLFKLQTFYGIIVRRRMCYKGRIGTQKRHLQEDFIQWLQSSPENGFLENTWGDEEAITVVQLHEGEKWAHEGVVKLL